MRPMLLPVQPRPQAALSMRAALVLRTTGREADRHGKENSPSSHGEENIRYETWDTPHRSQGCEESSCFAQQLTKANRVAEEKIPHAAPTTDSGMQDVAAQLSPGQPAFRGIPLVSGKPSPEGDLRSQAPEEHHGLEQYCRGA